ncbi:carbohydrate binding domain-containing protein [Armatimonas sp.]|uniref:carbohydrate binding domain-containing protein n=1 Tax=Armatimonas sp. TaxID=1872638 RepID=UPI003751D7E8
MNVILKPAGILVVLATFGALAFLAMPKKTKLPEATSQPLASGRSEVAPMPSKTGGSSNALSTRSLAKVNWARAKRILEPDITGSNWHSLITKGKVDNTVVPATITGHPFARHITISELGANPWDLQIAHPLEVAFKKKSHVRLTYWGRSKDGCSLAAVVEQASEPYTKVASRVAKLTPTWKQYSEEWEQTADTEPGWAHIDFQVGYQIGEIELTGVQLDSVE